MHQMLRKRGNLAGRQLQCNLLENACPDSQNQLASSSGCFRKQAAFQKISGTKWRPRMNKTPNSVIANLAGAAVTAGFTVAVGGTLFAVAPVTKADEPDCGELDLITCRTGYYAQQVLDGAHSDCAYYIYNPGDTYANCSNNFIEYWRSYYYNISWNADTWMGNNNCYDPYAYQPWEQPTTSCLYAAYDMAIGQIVADGLANYLVYCC